MSSPTNIERERERQRFNDPEWNDPSKDTCCPREGIYHEMGTCNAETSAGIAKQRSEKTNKAFSACSAGDLWRARRREETGNFMRIISQA